MRTLRICLLYGILTAAFLVPIACSEDEESIDSSDSDFYPELTPESGDDEAIDTSLFSLLNLDFAGLEKVKSWYEEGEYYYAASALLDYYRSRSSVFNPGIDLLTPTYTTSQKNIADQATADGGYRFYVNNYAESTDETTGLDIYYSFDDGNGGINWELVPEDADSQEWRYQKHRHQWMITQALVYRATMDETYIEAWIEIYGDWLETYPCPEGETDEIPWYGLQTSERLIDQCDIMMYYIQSENFTPEWLSTFLVAVSQHVENIRNNWVEDSTSNIRVSQEEAVTKAGIMFPEFLNSETWLAEGAAAMGSQVTTQFNEDGVHNELDPSYHISVIDSFYSIYKIAEANDKLSLFPDDYVDYLYKACHFVKDIIYPDYSIDNFNDTRSVSWTTSVLVKNFKKYIEMFPDDDELRWMATQGSSGTVPSDLINIYDVSGYYMMRSAWTSDAIMLILKNNYNPEDKWHCQPDNNHIGVYKSGRRFTPDAGVYTYDTGSTRTSYRSTEMHTTMTMDQETISSTNMLGEYLGWYSGDNYEVIVSENDSYSTLTHRRAVFFVENSFFVVVDEGYGSADGNTVNLNFKLWARTSETWTDMVDSYDDEPLAYGCHSIFSDNNNMIFKTFSETSDGFAGSYNSSYYSDAIDTRQQRLHYRVDVTKSADLAARFITVIYPFSAVSDFDSIAISAEFTDNADGTAGTFHSSGASVSVTVNDTTYDLSYSLN